MAENSRSANKLALAAGFGIGVLWIAMALYCLYSAISGFSDNRPDYGLAWSLVGVLLLGAGVMSVLGTWWHQLRPHHEEH